MTNRQAFLRGMKAGVPIALGYFAVSFSLGIAAKAVGLTPFQGFLASLLNSASAGEYALFSLIGAGASLIELLFVTLVANGRYLLMSCALGQKFSEDTPLIHRIGVGFYITDEIFSLSITTPGKLNPFLNYGAIAVAVPAWSVGTALGVIAGNILPANLVSALSVALYGMFIACFLPPAKQNRVLLCAIPVCFFLSYVAFRMPVIGDLSEGTRAVILTVLIATVLALVFPLKDEKEEAEV
ncbi:MAG: AzlC family ABC transporter permease [Spirochaetales bacterium]|nr:AzlC family ABC transporter permease [Spirochaetales bacterium]MBO6049465.1 AzlC family ABC transporter permease [Spirochaetales bacterium]